MYIAVAFIISVVIIAGFVKLVQVNKGKIKFYLEGFDSGFTLSEIILLWKVVNICDIQEPNTLFWSMPTLSRCISQIKYQSETTNSVRMQKLLSKLYSYRTRIEKNEDKKRGLESTHSLDSGQRLRIILPGKGVFASEIVNNARELTIRIPTQKGSITVEGKDWIGKTVSVYLWRKGDARYVFDTTVDGESLFLGKPSLFLKHTNNLIRTQKRNSIRAKCKIYASLFIIKEKIIDYSMVETKPGYRCLIEDISESGALVRIGGRGQPDIQIKLQFQLANRLIIMFGVIRTVEFNNEMNQSRLHFECIHIEPAMKNEILSYVYNILPQNEKEIYDAMTLMDADEKETAETKNKAENTGNNEKEEEETLPSPDDIATMIPQEDSLKVNAEEVAEQENIAVSDNAEKPADDINFSL